jgi:tetratricopeptide (TPR) repeat protein
MDRARKFQLPPAPPSENGPVKAWSQPVVIPTYPPLPADRNPMFLEKRIYQGSSGRVYPLPFTDRIATERIERAWQALHIENEFLRVMILPEIGGRIHVGLDKTNGYDFFYRQNVIKPALVGLAGPWISGGVEFNWPQHHRPATFMPVNTHIEEHEDGSRTIWCSDHDPMERMKGMHGVCLHPGRAYIELKVRLYNRTPLPQTFLWWANAATRVHERYQSFFPGDVRYVADHAKRAISSFPLCDSAYYGIDYAARAKNGVPLEELPRCFRPSGPYSPADLSWYANIPVPTSYMAMGSSGDFFGGYDHERRAGMVHIASHHIAPGKKQWTWGNHDFGYTWDRHLTDDDGPYIELMAGVYTDNQPDFSFLMPGETKSFRQYWYPIQGIGPAQKANLDAAISLHFKDGRVHVGVSVSRPFRAAKMELLCRGERLALWERRLAPGSPALEDAAMPAGAKETDLSLVVTGDDGSTLIQFTPPFPKTIPAPRPATEPPLPAEIVSTDELFVTGLHLEQYRHATRAPELYWEEALRRDAGDARSNNALGLLHLRRGQFKEAERHFRTAIARLTAYNPNPYDGEPYYNLGIILRYLGREEEAYAAFYKAAWNHAWQSAAYHALAELDARRQDWTQALQHVESSLRLNTDHLKARNLKALVLRRLNRELEARALLERTLHLDPLDCWARHLAGSKLAGDNQVRLDVALDYGRAGFYAEAIEVLLTADMTATDGSLPMVRYTLGMLYHERGLESEAADWYAAASAACPDYCFPSRLEEIEILAAAMRVNPRDGRAAFYLGNLLYDRRRHREAISLWRKAARLEPRYSVVWRNLGIACFNVLGDVAGARKAFDRAFAAAPGDARILYERDQLWKRTGEAPATRLGQLEKHRDLVAQRDDLSLELIALYHQMGRHEDARRMIESRCFQPWEGGEGLVLELYVLICLALGRAALAAEHAHEAIEFFQAALAPPANIGEANHLLNDHSDIYYWLGIAHRQAGETREARRWWRKAAVERPPDEMTYYHAMALRQLGRDTKAAQLLHDLQAHAGKLRHAQARVDYFATSLPAMLLFDDDLQKRQSVRALFLEAQALAALGKRSAARKRLAELSALDRYHARAAGLAAEIAP